MAKATAKCTCAKCGKIFEVTQICYNREEANRFEDYAERNYTECRDCYRDRIAKENAEKAKNIIEKYGFPAAIEGKSEKQINYANNLRDKYLVKCDTSRLDALDDFCKGIADDNYLKMLKEEADQSYNGDVEKLKKEIMEYYDIAKLYTLKTETNASAIIDLLKFA